MSKMILIDEATVKLVIAAIKKCHYYMIDAGLPNHSMLVEAYKAYAALEATLTEQPAQRTWVGLTQDEVRDFASTLEYGTGGLIRAIEAKIKEKQNGH